MTKPYARTSRTRFQGLAAKGSSKPLTNLSARMPGMRTPLMLCFLILTATGLRAELTVKAYRENLVSDDNAVVRETRGYVLGLGEGMQYAEIELEVTKRVHIFCAPPKLAVTMENCMDILDRQIKKAATFLTEARLTETTIDILLMVGLKETFPCSGK